MSHHEEDFKETTSAISVTMILLAFVGTGLLPMLLQWFSLLS